MKHLFQPLSEVPHAANPRTSRNPADIVRLLVFLTTGTLFLPAVTAATSVVALIDNTNHRVVIAADLDTVARDSRTIRDPWGASIDVFESSYRRLDRCATRDQPLPGPWSAPHRHVISRRDP